MKLYLSERERMVEDVMNSNQASTSNWAITKPAFLILFLVMLVAALSVQTVYAADGAAPAKPSGFETKADTGTITLNWTANTEANLGGYNIYRNTTDTTVGAMLASVEASATSYVDTSVEAATTYYYWLSAIDTATPANESEKAGPVWASLSSSEQPKQPHKFMDITNAHWARSYIEELLSSGIVNGYADGTFHPQSNVTRAEFAKMICEIMVKKANWTLSTETSTSLTDISGHWAFTYIQTVKENGVMVGYTTTDGVVFKPDKNITRAEIAKIIAAVLKLERGQSNLKDIKSHWAKDDINACVKAGIVSGYKDGNFEPSSFATRAEVCKMLVKMLKLLDTQKNHGKSAH